MKEKYYNQSMYLKSLNYSIKKNNYYLGIEILRVILSFFIVLVHLFNKKYAKTKILLFPFHALPFYIPIFFIISFYFNYKTFVSRNIVKIKERFLRILIPFFIWPTLFFIENLYLNYINASIENNDFKKLYCQYLIGAGTHGVFWFQFNLIFITLIFIIIIFSFKANYLFIVQIIGFIMCIFNISGNNDKLFLKYTRLISHTVMKIPISLIYSISGFLLASLNILNYLYNFRIKSIIIVLIFFYILLVYPFFYFNIIKINFISINMFLIFSLLPFDKIKYNIIIFIKYFP
jgi:hypothetical protein